MQISHCIPAKTYSINLSKVAQAFDNPISIRLNSNKHLDVANAVLEAWKEVETEIQKMVDNEIIQPSHSPWSKAMVVVKKPTGIIICFDYWKLNEVTVKDSYPLPRIDD
jgi:hypothetical protein